MLIDGIKAVKCGVCTLALPHKAARAMAISLPSRVGATEDDKDARYKSTVTAIRHEMYTVCCPVRKQQYSAAKQNKHSTPKTSGTIKSGQLCALGCCCGDTASSRQQVYTWRAKAGKLTLAKALCCWAWLLAWASSLATTRRRLAKASSAAAILSRSPTFTTTNEILPFVSTELQHYSPLVATYI